MNKFKVKFLKFYRIQKENKFNYKSTVVLQAFNNFSKWNRKFLKNNKNLIKNTNNNNNNSKNKIKTLIKIKIETTWKTGYILFIEFFFIF